MIIKELKQQAEGQMTAARDAVRSRLGKLRTGKASPALLQGLRENSPERIGGATRRKRDHQPHGPVGVVLRERKRRRCEKNERRGQADAAT